MAIIRKSDRIILTEKEAVEFNKNIKNKTNDLFGEVRHLTEKENEAYLKGLESISEPTGIELFNN